MNQKKPQNKMSAEPVVNNFEKEKQKKHGTSHFELSF